MKHLVVITSLLGLFACAGNKIDRRLISEGSKAFPWKIWYVTEDNFPVGKRSYYEVNYKDKDFALPKELFGTENEITSFVSAAGFNTSDTDYGAVVLVFYKITKQESGHSDWNLTTALVRRLNSGKENHFTVYADGLEQHFELK